MAPATSFRVVGGNELHFGGGPQTSLGVWDGQEWSDLLQDVPAGTVTALAAFDPDGLRPQSASLVVGGSFSGVGAVDSPDIAGWNADGWFPIGADGDVLTLSTLDVDGPGAGLSALYASGSFHTIGGITADRAAWWDGDAWHAMGGLNLPAIGFAVFDADGDGPEPGMLYAAGDFTKADGLTVNRIARWDGASWTAPPGGGFDKKVTALAVCDPDGPGGPSGRILVAGGSFTTAGGKPAPGLAMWDGAAWKPMDGISASNVSALLDPGEADPGWTVPLLLVAGTLTLEMKATVGPWLGRRDLDADCSRRSRSWRTEEVCALLGLA